MRAIIASAIVISILVLSTILVMQIRSVPQGPEPQIVEAPPSEPEPEPEWVEYEIKKGDYLGSILPSYGISTQAVLDASSEIYDLAKIRVGKKLLFMIQPEEKIPEQIHYALDEDNTLILERTGESWSAKKKTNVYESKLAYRHLRVDSSFWKAAINVGLRDGDIANLIKVLEYDIDFNTEIRAGATADILIEELYQKNVLVKLGTPHALIFTNKGKSFTAIHHTDVQGDSDYYDEEGISRKGAFLRSPLAFSRVTSSFNPKRFHPVLKKRRPHNGTDFGAPTGTPVRAVGKGKVLMAGKNGGHGKFIKLDHQDPYQTSYSHLSKIYVKKGQKVKQGQVIGKVGTTGMSTGPHLHFQMWKNGRYVDAMTEKLPRETRILKAEKAVFDKKKNEMLEILRTHTAAAEEG
jgi:murein DD-endopeptidase MepM/ murein hydrolase activator NlpD